ncbi:MAG: hypothetical protein M3R72_08290 [Bacteroidota bacterium]|nr:hypothetical protein [Bacteroidota bacterium]
MNNNIELYQYIASFFAGAFLTNAIPHLFNGISGNSFPTPFAKPPGKGLSSPTVNVIWALGNLVVGYLLYRFARISSQNNISLLLFFAGTAFLSITLSKHFSQKEK